MKWLANFWPNWHLLICPRQHYSPKSIFWLIKYTTCIIGTTFNMIKHFSQEISKNVKQFWIPSNMNDQLCFLAFTWPYFVQRSKCLQQKWSCEGRFKLFSCQMLPNVHIAERTNNFGYFIRKWQHCLGSTLNT